LLGSRLRHVRAADGRGCRAVARKHDIDRVFDFRSGRSLRKN
jgi:hypothetical protein